MPLLTYGAADVVMEWMCKAMKCGPKRVSPHSHALLNVSWRHTVAQANHKLHVQMEYSALSSASLKGPARWSRSFERWSAADGQNLSESLTLAICLTLITYLASSVPGLMIFVHLATYRITFFAHSAAIRDTWK